MADEKTNDPRMKIINRLVFGDGLPDRCKGRQWAKPEDRLKCQFPAPPLGRWKAVYTRDFAQAYNLPPENISTDFSPGVDYMEMEVMPYGNGGTACLANMLVKKPHDIALYAPYNNDGTISSYIPPLPQDRKLTHFIDLQKYKSALKPLSSFMDGSRDYTKEKTGYRGSTISMYAEDVLPGYDYIAANANCTNISRHALYYPGGYAFWINKASVWGRYEMLHRNADAPDTPKGLDFDRSFFSINIPHELISTIFDGVVIGGK